MKASIAPKCSLSLNLLTDKQEPIGQFQHSMHFVRLNSRPGVSRFKASNTTEWDFEMKKRIEGYWEVLWKEVFLGQLGRLNTMVAFFHVSSSKVSCLCAHYLWPLFSISLFIASIDSFTWNSVCCSQCKVNLTFLSLQGVSRVGGC